MSGAFVLDALDDASLVRADGLGLEIGHDDDSHRPADLPRDDFQVGHLQPKGLDQEAVARDNQEGRRHRGSRDGSHATGSPEDDR